MPKMFALRLPEDLIDRIKAAAKAETSGNVTAIVLDRLLTAFPAEPRPVLQPAGSKPETAPKCHTAQPVIQVGAPEPVKAKSDWEAQMEAARKAVAAGHDVKKTSLRPRSR